MRKTRTPRRRTSLPQDWIKTGPESEDAIYDILRLHQKYREWQTLPAWKGMDFSHWRLATVFRQNNNFYVGACYPDRQLIVVAMKYGYTEALSTLLHEMAHVVQFEFGGSLRQRNTAHGIGWMSIFKEAVLDATGLYPLSVSMREGDLDDEASFLIHTARIRGVL